MKIILSKDNEKEEVNILPLLKLLSKKYKNNNVELHLKKGTYLSEGYYGKESLGENVIVIGENKEKTVITDKKMIEKLQILKVKKRGKV